MADWWRTEILDAGKQPLFLCAVAFLVTFAVTRLIVRLIRAGRGPFTNNTVGGMHLHHVVPGIVLMVVWGLVALGSESVGWESAAAVGFGAGAALVLDEFALILHLDDVYWTEEGRTSLDAVFLTAGVLDPGVARARHRSTSAAASEAATSAPASASWWWSPSTSSAVADDVLEGEVGRRGHRA